MDPVVIAEILTGIVVCQPFRTRAPCNHEVAVVVHSHGRLALRARRRGVNAESTVQGANALNQRLLDAVTVRVDVEEPRRQNRVRGIHEPHRSETPGEDVAHRTVLHYVGYRALPSDDEFPVGVHCHVGAGLIESVRPRVAITRRERVVGLRRVDAELGARLLAGVDVDFRRKDDRRAALVCGCRNDQQRMVRLARRAFLRDCPTVERDVELRRARLHRVVRRVKLQNRAHRHARHGHPDPVGVVLRAFGPVDSAAVSRRIFHRPHDEVLGSEQEVLLDGVGRLVGIGRVD